MNIICRFKGHRWTKWHQEGLSRHTGQWRRYCNRGDRYQTGGYGKRVNHKGIKEYK